MSACLRVRARVFVCVCVRVCVRVRPPGLPVHASHAEALPAGVQQGHLLPDLVLLLHRQVALGDQLVARLKHITHAALVRRQLHHEGLAGGGHRGNVEVQNRNQRYTPDMLPNFLTHELWVHVVL